MILRPCARPASRSCSMSTRSTSRRHWTSSCGRGGHVCSARADRACTATCWPPAWSTSCPGPSPRWWWPGRECARREGRLSRCRWRSSWRSRCWRRTRPSSPATAPAGSSGSAPVRVHVGLGEHRRVGRDEGAGRATATVLQEIGDKGDTGPDREREHRENADDKSHDDGEVHESSLPCWGDFGTSNNEVPTFDAASELGFFSRGPSPPWPLPQFSPPAPYTSNASVVSEP